MSPGGAFERLLAPAPLPVERALRAAHSLAFDQLDRRGADLRAFARTLDPGALGEIAISQSRWSRWTDRPILEAHPLWAQPRSLGELGTYAGLSDAEARGCPGRARNARLIRATDRVVERPWTAEDPRLAELARALSEAGFPSLAEHFETGRTDPFDAYLDALVRDRGPRVVYAGFLETIRDPLGVRGTFEAIAGTLRSTIHAAWLAAHSEDLAADLGLEHHPPGRVDLIDVTTTAGQAYPLLALGKSFPEDPGRRRSLVFANAIEGHQRALVRSGAHAIFRRPAAIERAERFGARARIATVFLHEALGHALGRRARPLSSAAEEARAELIALLSMLHSSFEALEPSDADELRRAAFEEFFRGALFTQAARLRPGDAYHQPHTLARHHIAIRVAPLIERSDHVSIDRPESLAEPLRALLAEIDGAAPIEPTGPAPDRVARLRAQAGSTPRWIALVPGGEGPIGADELLQP